MEESSFLQPPAAVAAAGITEGMQVADFGAGSGFFTRAAAREVGKSGAVWAVDVHRDLLPRIKTLSDAEGLHNVEVMHGNIEDPEGSRLPAGRFDFVIISNVLFAAQDKAAVVAEAHRVLNKTGRALVIDWSDSFGGLGPHPDHVVSRDEAATLFERGGFRIGRDVPAGSYHWGFVAKNQVQ